MQVALSGLENILRIGKQDAFQTDGVNQFAVMVEEAYGKFETTPYCYCETDFELTLTDSDN